MRVRVASAGTGKTTSLVRRYLELIGTGVPLRRIAGVTFTRAAAAELRARVGAGLRELVAEGAYLGGLYSPPDDDVAPFEEALRELGGAQLNTIHGFMIAGLRLSAPLLGFDPRFAMVPEPEAKADFAEELDSLRLLARDPAHELHAAVLVAGEHGVDLPSVIFGSRSLAPELRFDDDPLSSAVGQIYRAAYRRLLDRYASRRLGPGEVERAALRLLAHPVACARLVSRYPVVLVDEYQDVNPMQGSFFEGLEAAGARLELVGDPKQSIYLFRNADVNVFRRALASARETGDVLAPLTESRRHARAVAAFLNRLTTRLAERSMGFGPDEAPEVSAAGPQAEVEGSVEVIAVRGAEGLDGNRAYETQELIDRLIAFNAQGVPYDRMAVLARKRRQLGRVETALAARGVPALYGRRGLFARQEVRDVRYALEVGAGPTREALAAFLRGPLVGLELDELRAAMTAADPVAALTAVSPAARAVVQELRAIVRAPPLEALKAVLRRGLAGGPPLVDRLSAGARANLDAMLFEVAAHEPDDLTRLLELLAELEERSEAEEVPGSGSGVRLLTVHGSKGLEYDLVAVYDAGYTPRGDAPGAVVEPDTGRVALLGAVAEPAAAQAWSDRSAQEEHRLLYVAASRARDHLIVTGSVGFRGPAGWLGTLLDVVMPGGELPQAVGLTEVEAHGPVPLAATVAGEPRATLAPAEWSEVTFPHHVNGPLSSPSRLVDLLAERSNPGQGPADVTGPVELDEPLTRFEAIRSGEETHEAGVVERDEPAPGLDLSLPGRGRVIGTLVHFAISQDWSPDDGRLESLRAQEVMFPYSAAEQDDLLDEVRDLLAAYHGLLGAKLPALPDREDDRAELPLAYPGGPTVWEGVIDRLYRVSGQWWIDDYKTDRHVRPERYHVQLGLYLHTVRSALGVSPRARLVYLRPREVVELDADVLQDALRRSGVLGPG
ncbi:MAG TPA: UvrD-helicase domain-containing protein [Trueperaceae bacterium]